MASLDESVLGNPGEPLVERGVELALLGRLVRDVADGRAAVLTIRGAPGTGRSTLLRHAAALARGAGIRVLETDCYPSEIARPDSVPRQAFARLGLAMPPLPAKATEESLRDLARCLLAGAGGGPLALLVNDAHWADARSLRWLRALASVAKDEAVLLAVTKTTELSHSDSSRWPGEQVVELSPLSFAGVAELVRRGHPDVDDRTVHIALRASRGNPALLCEGLRRVAPLPARLDALPEVCAAIAVERFERLLDGLPGELLTVLRVVALCQGAFSTALLAELAGCPARLSGHLAFLRAMGLVAGAEAGPPVAEAVLAGMTEADRNELFVRAAALGHRDGVPTRTVGVLLTHSRPVGEPWAVDALRAAAREARASGGHEEAVALLVRALREPLAPDTQASVLLELGAAELPVSPRASDRHLQQVLAGEAAWPQRVAAADLLLARGDGRAAARASSAAFHRPQLSISDRAGLLGLYWLAEDQLPAAGEFSDSEMPLLSERPADPTQAAAAAARLAARGSRPARVRGLARAALGAAIAGPVPLSTGVAAAETLRLTGDLAEAGARGDELLAGARARGARVLIGRTLLTRAHLRLSAGSLAGAEEDLAQVHEAVPAGWWHPAARSYLVAVEVLLDLELRRTDHAERAAASSPGLAGTGFAGIYLMYATSLVRRLTGRVAEALSGFVECGRWLSSRGWRNPELLPWRSAAAGCLIVSGDEEGGTRLVAEEIELAKEWGTPTGLGCALLRAAKVVGPGESATRWLEESVRLLGRSDARLRHGEALVELAAAKLAAGERAVAGACAEEATALAEHHGWSHLGARLRELARELGGEFAPPVLGLSRAQRQVAELAAQGVSNAGIADRLAVTKRTVELHLTQVYRKLGIVGRRQLHQALCAAVLET
jgi:DNA-binding CsgD family transcriptional regulator